MSFRALGSLLARRFSTRGVPRAHAQSRSSPAIVVPGSGTGRPARSLHTLRDLPALGDGAYGAAATAVLAGIFAILYFKKDAEQPVGEEARKEAPGKEIRKEMPDPDTEVIKEGDLNDAAIRAKFMKKDGTFAWLEYIDYLNDRDFRGGKTYKREVCVKEASVKQEDEDVKIDEEAMKARFQEWMRQYGRSYKSEDERAWRYGIFKENAMDVDRRNKRNASKPNGARFRTNEFADWTKEEWESRMGRSGDFPWEEYLAHRNSMIAQGRVMTGIKASEKAISGKS
ncbi:hypothetical protein ACP4OV_017614 [Aristida adscensionis]